MTIEKKIGVPKLASNPEQESGDNLSAWLKNLFQDGVPLKELSDILEARSLDPLLLSNLITGLNKYGNLQNRLKKELTENDINLLQLAINYFEDWFYRGKWVITPEDQSQRANENSYAYFSVPANIINAITKLKEKDEVADKVSGFNRERFNGFVDEIDGFAAKLFNNELKSVMSSSDIDNAKKVFKQSEKSVKGAAAGPYQHKAGDLYFLKTCLIAGEMTRREKQNGSKRFIPDVTMPTIKNEYLPFDFSAGKDPRNNSMHYPTHRISFCKFVVEYLRRSVRP